MGENFSQRPSLVSFPNFLLLMLVAGGVYFYRPPLQSTRPVSTVSAQSTREMRLNKQSAEYHVKLVPLSQDPFLVADEVLESTGIAATVASALQISSAPFWKPETKSADAIRVIFFMTPTGHAAERVEHRLRARQAALGALRSEGFTPVHPGNIFHLALDPSQWTHQSFSAPYEFSPKAAAAAAGADGTPPRFRLTSFRAAAESQLLPQPTSPFGLYRYAVLSQEERAAESFVSGSRDAVIFPYEWFAQDVVAARAGHVNSISHVLVIWMPEGKFGSENLAVLRTIITGLRSRLRKNEASMTVPAPADSPPPPPSPRVPSASTAAPPPTDPVSVSATKWTSRRVLATSMAPLDLSRPDDTWPSFALVGPTTSTTLRAMLEESTQLRPSNGDADLIKLLRVYAPSPSAEPFLMTSLDPSKAGESLGTIDEKFAKSLPFPVFERVCQTDDVIAQALVDELRMRGLHIVPTSSEWKIAQANDDGNLLDNIALVCEHESLYGRAFPQTFNATLWHMAEGDGKTYRERNADWRTKHSSRPPNIHVYFYPQGVDAPSPQTDAAGKREERSNAPSATGPRLPELPEGPGQLDYIRRLAQSLSAEYRRAGRNRLRAVGIIGTDVYDKMLLLQALRAEFPDILFFTTDLDARLFHHTNFPFTRNLIVASSYGLDLRDRYQRTSGIATFRDSGQTATFVACRLALSDAAMHDAVVNPDAYGTILANQVRDSIRQPIVFEVGYERTATLSPQSQPDDSLHPRVHPVLGPGYWVLVLLAISLFLALAIYVFPPIRDRLSIVFFRAVRWTGIRYGLDPSFHESVPANRTDAERLAKKRLRLLTGVAVVGLVTGLMLYVSIPISHYLGGEPFAIAAGYSSWPSIAISHMAFVLTLYFLVESWFRLRSVEIRVDEQFGLGNSAAVPSRSGLLLPLSVWSAQRYSDGKVDVQLLWGQFKALGTLSNRLVRVGTLFTVLALFGLVMYLLFGESNDPLRGTLNWLAGRLTMLGALTALVLLTLFVVDGTSLVLAFVRNLGTGASHYESSSLRLLWARQFTEDGKSADSDSAPEENLHRIQELADVAIIAELASSVFSILLYPFITLTLLILARSTVFDNFVWSTVLVAVYGMLFAYALWCAVALQRTAERVRTNAIAVARRKLDAVRRSNARRSKDAAAVYESSIHQIETAKSGAFMSLYDNPILRAVLIPTGGTTLITLFEYLSRL